MTHGENKKNFLVVEAEEFIALITQHIPEKSQQLTRYYGFYSNKTRGQRLQREEQILDPSLLSAINFDPTSIPIDEIETIDVSKYKPPRLPPKTWRECIKKIWELDPLECPNCHAEMKIISFITKAQDDVIRKILEHLGLWEEETRPPPSLKKAEAELTEIAEITYEPIDDGWPGYEEPYITVD